MNNKYMSVLIFVFIGIITLAYRFPDLNMPLERDEGEYAYAAQQMLTGNNPYITTFCQKPPVVFFWYIAAFILFGQSVFAIHIIMATAAFLTSVGLYQLYKALRLIDPMESPFRQSLFYPFSAALIYTLSAAGTGYFGTAANTEIFMVLPMVWCIYFLVQSFNQQTWHNGFLCGVFFAFSVLTKQVALFSFAGPFLFLSFLWIKQKKVPMMLLLSGSAGVIISIIPFCLWVLQSSALGGFLYSTLYHNINYVGFPFGFQKWMQVLKVLTNRFGADVFLWLYAAVSMLLAILVPSFRNDRRLLFLQFWLFTSLFGVALGPYTFGHYFLQLLPPLSLVAALFMNKLGVRHTGLSKKHLTTGVFVLLLTLLPMLFQRIIVLKQSPQQRSYNLYSIYGPSPFNAAVQIGKYIKEETRPEQKILLVGSEPEILFYAQRESSTRYTIFYPLTDNYERANDMIEELFKDIQQNPPEIIVLVYCRTSFIYNPEKIKFIFSQVNKIIEKSYTEQALVYSDQLGNVDFKKGPSHQTEGLTAQYHIFKKKSIL